MHIEAIYDKGRLEFKTPLRLKRDTLTVIVEVPDEAIDTADHRHQEGARALADIRHILGSFSKARPATSPAQDKAAFAEALADKYSQ
ncbi:hypothetical protein [Halochromatium salexigens]|uniref:Uncharacterized protein n=1 Tax=Halochromatium salexigens TaxID=49447 RepID=A0AAJ0XE01_HALSE|nr:hypothetical protein [Halochromatium salexigens]MBK5929309.1 hypothetical protein [Halochromatium salexigens]